MNHKILLPTTSATRDPGVHVLIFLPGIYREQTLGKVFESFGCWESAVIGNN